MKPILILLTAAAAAAQYVTWPGASDTPVPGAENFPTCELRDLHGSSVPFVNGDPLVRIAIASSSDHSASLAEKLDCGMRLVKTRALAIGGPDQRLEARGEIDWSVTKILDAIPDARIIIRLNVQPTQAFLAAHPESRVTGANGETEFQERFNRYFLDVPLYRPSWASLAWREYVDREIRALCAYLATRPYAGRIIGFNLSAGHTGEFDQWFGGEGWPGGLPGDWAPESVAHFRNWLRAAYADDENALRAAWGDPRATFATAAIAADKLTLDPVSSFYDPASGRARWDYERFYRRQVPETIASWSHSIKVASGGRLLTGAMYAVGDGGCRLLNTSPDVDFGSGPGTYFYREPGNHRRLDFAGEELRRHHKWFFEEMDLRTMYYGAEEYAVETVPKTLAVLARTHAQITTEGVCGYWYEFRSRTFRHPAIWRLFRRQAEISELAASEDRTVPAQVLLLYSEDTGLGRTSGDLRTNIMSRLGAPYHTLLLETLVEQNIDPAPYRLVIFAGTPAIAAPQREWLRRRLFRDGRWCLFLRPGGAVDMDAVPPLDLAHSTALHGIALAPKPGDRRDVAQRYAAQAVVPGLAPDALLADADEDVPRHPRPTAWTVVNDPDATVLTTWADGQPAGALKRRADWTAVYVPTLRVGSAFLRAVADAAGVHRYVTNHDDVVYAGGQLLNIHTRQPGTRTVHLREPADLYDLYGETFVGHGRDTYEVAMDAPANHLYYLGDPRERLAAIREALDLEILARRYAREERLDRRLEEATVPPPPGPYDLLPNGKIRNWLFAGPVALPDVPADQWVEYGKQQLPLPHLATPLGELHPAPFAPVVAADQTQRFAWRPLATGGARFYAADFYSNPGRRLMFYVAIYLEADRDGPVNLHLRTERGHQLYLDGTKIGESFYRGPTTLDFPLQLTAGARHLLLFKVFSAGGGNTGWWAQLTNADGTPATHVHSWYAPR